MSDLTNIQYQVVNYWQTKQKLPTALSDLNDPISGFTVPVDPQPEDSYSYKTSGTMSFELCATFNEISPGTVPDTMTVPMPAGAVGGSISDDWWHGAGDTCFIRTIDPERYPPFSKTSTQ